VLQSLKEEKKMGYLSDKSVYLAGPMHAVEDDGIGWRHWISPILERRWNLKVEDPSKKVVNGVVEIYDHKEYFKSIIESLNWEKIKEEFYPIVRKDLRCVDKADLIIAVYDPTVHMFGTIHELVMAHLERKPIYVFVNSDNAKKINPWLFTLIQPDWLFLEWEQMFKRLDKVDQGDINPEYWSLT
jgi:hypothetical protein